MTPVKPAAPKTKSLDNDTSTKNPVSLDPSKYFQVVCDQKAPVQAELAPTQNQNTTTSKKNKQAAELRQLFNEAVQVFHQKKTELIETTKPSEAIKMIGDDLCTGIPLFRDSLQNSCEMQKAETYFRSAQTPHPTATIEENEKNSSTRGVNAHIGNYKNTYDIKERSGFESSDKQVATSKGDALLYNKFLDAKDKACKYVATNAERLDLKRINVGYYNEYGCFMVHILQNTSFNNTADNKKFYAWENLLLSCFTALVNYHCWFNGIPIELERRSGFGFMIPTVANTDGSFRVNIGIVPKEFTDIMLTCLTILDNLIAKTLENMTDTDFVTAKKVVASKENKNYRNPPKFKACLTQNAECNIIFKNSKLLYKKQVTNSTDGSQSSPPSFTSVLVPEEISKILLANINLKDKEKEQLKTINFNLEQLLEKDPRKLIQALPECLPLIFEHTMKSWRDLLWAPFDKDNGTVAENIVRTPYGRHMLSYYIVTSLIEQQKLYDSSALPNSAYYAAFTSAINEILKQFFYKKSSNGTSLSLKQDNTGLYSKFSHKFSNKSVFHIKDEVFWGAIKALVKKLENSSVTNEVSTVITCLKKYLEFRVIDNHFYSILEILNELLFMAAIENGQKRKGAFGDGLGSDSDMEEDDKKPSGDSKAVSTGKKLFGKKILSHNGMRTIVLALKAIEKWQSKQKTSESSAKTKSTTSSSLAQLSIYFKGSYYEVPEAIKLLSDSKKINFPHSKSAGDTDILMIDANPCVTTTPESGSNDTRVKVPAKCKVLLVDATSADLDEYGKYLNEFSNNEIEILIYIESGAKHQQFFTKNPYGIIRIFAKTKQTRDDLYEIIKGFGEGEAIYSETAHALRQIMKELGMIPTNSAIVAASKKVESL